MPNRPEHREQEEFGGLFYVISRGHIPGHDSDTRYDDDSYALPFSWGASHMPHRWKDVYNVYVWSTEARVSYLGQLHAGDLLSTTHRPQSLLPQDRKDEFRELAREEFGLDVEYVDTDLISIGVTYYQLKGYANLTDQ